MKRGHRQAHFRIWIALAILLTVGFAAGQFLKKPLPYETTPLKTQTTS